MWGSLNKYSDRILQTENTSKNSEPHAFFTVLYGKNNRVTSAIDNKLSLLGSSKLIECWLCCYVILGWQIKGQDKLKSTLFSRGFLQPRKTTREAYLPLRVQNMT